MKGTILLIMCIFLGDIQGSKALPCTGLSCGPILRHQKAPYIPEAELAYSAYEPKAEEEEKEVNFANLPYDNKVHKTELKRQQAFVSGIISAIIEAVKALAG